MSATPSHSRRNSAAATRTPAAGSTSPRKAQRTPIAPSSKRTSEEAAIIPVTPMWHPGSSVNTPFRASQGYRNPLSASQMSAPAGPPGAGNPMVPAVPMDGLDFSAMYNKIENFMVTFNAFISGEIAAAEMLREEHDSSMVLDKEEIKGLETEVEDAKKEQSGLWDTIKTQKEADAAERSDITKLRGTQSSLNSKRTNLEHQLNELARLSSSKRKAQDDKKSMLTMQRSKNEVELRKLRELTGLKVTPTKVPGQLRVAYELINPDDFFDEHSFILDLADVGGGKQYTILDCKPPLSAEKLAQINAQLAKTRDPWEVIKAMRAEFKAVAEETRKKRRGLV